MAVNSTPGRDSAELKASQQAAWDGVAPGWEKWDAFHELHTSAVNEWLCTSAALAPGKTLLDLASGSGQPALLAARMVFPGGRVIATDIAPQMVEVVKRRAAAEGIPNLETRVMDIERMDLGDESVDAVTCRWGYMFCPDLDAAMAHSKRVLRPGGRLSLAVWSRPEDNPWLGLVVSALDRVAPQSGLADPDALGPFRLSDPRRLTGVLRSVGLADYALEVVGFRFDFESPEQWWEFVLDIAAPVRNRISLLDGPAQAEVRRLVVAESGRFLSDGKIQLPAANLCAVATR
jgi:ubiquinone/menaquinone biosynthesis C-methylase UbiE